MAGAFRILFPSFWVFAHEMLARASAARMEHGDHLSDDNKDNDAILNMILHKEPGSRFEEITLDDFEVVNYSPMKPQLKFELGI